MKPGKYSAEKAFIRRSAGSAERKRDVTEEEKIAVLSKETGVSVRALTLFSKISEDKTNFTAEQAHKVFGRVRRKQAA